MSSWMGRAKGLDTLDFRLEDGCEMFAILCENLCFPRPLQLAVVVSRLVFVIKNVCHYPLGKSSEIVFVPRAVPHLLISNLASLCLIAALCPIVRPSNLWIESNRIESNRIVSQSQPRTPTEPYRLPLAKSPWLRESH